MYTRVGSALGLVLRCAPAGMSTGLRPASAWSSLMPTSRTCPPGRGCWWTRPWLRCQVHAHIHGTACCCLAALAPHPAGCQQVQRSSATCGTLVVSALTALAPLPMRAGASASRRLQDMATNANAVAAVTLNKWWAPPPDSGTLPVALAGACCACTSLPHARQHRLAVTPLPDL